MRPPLPPSLVETARAYAAGTRTPVEPKDAATVVLMRPSAAGPEVYLLRRQTSMAFAGGMCVFPGGGVDPRDFDAEVAWAGPPVSAWASWLGVDEALARALVCAAVRETFEESGVLLAGPSADEVVADTTGDDWEADRVALEGRTLSLTDLLARRGLVLRTDLLGVWAAWTTPVFEPRRYRTWFFVADLPVGAAHPRRVERVRPGRLAARARGRRAGRGGQHRHVAADVPHLPGARDVRRPGGRRSPRRSGRSVEMFTPAAGRGGRRLDAVDARLGSRRCWQPEAAVSAPALGRRLLRHRGHLRARRQRLADDPRRHQHVGAARARGRAVGGDRPGAAVGGAPRGGGGRGR